MFSVHGPWWCCIRIGNFSEFDNKSQLVIGREWVFGSINRFIGSSTEEEEDSTVACPAPHVASEGIEEDSAEAFSKSSLEQKKKVFSHHLFKKNQL